MTAMGTPKSKAASKAKPPTTAKRGRGRPPTYRQDFVDQARKLCELGATDFEVAKFFEVTTTTLYRWRHDHPEFCEALKAGKHALDERVVRSLAHRALGYTFESEKIFAHQGRILRAKTVEHVPPDTTAMIFWLKNRRPAEFRDRQEQVKYDVHMSLAELVAMSYRPDLPEPKVIEHDGTEKDGTENNTDGT